MIAIQTQELQQDWQTETAVDVQASRDETIRSLLYLVQHIAGRLVAKLPSHIAKEDLISAGVVGLIDAVDRYDSSKGCSLKTYSSLRIRGAMVDELRNQDWVPRTVHRDEKIYDQAAEKLGQKHGREATPEGNPHRARHDAPGLRALFRADPEHHLLFPQRGLLR